MTQTNHVRLKILCERLTPEDIAAATGFDPDRFWKIGDFRGRTTAKEVKNGGVVESRLPEEAPLHDHICALLSRLESFRPRILQISNSTEVQFSCAIYAPSLPALFFEKDIIAKIASLGACLDVDLYIIPDQ